MKEKRYILLLHIGFWVLNFLYGILFWSKVSSIARLFFIIPFYINYFILVPYFFRKGTVTALLVWFLMLWGAFAGLHVAYYYGYYFLTDDLEYLKHSKVTWIGGYVAFYFIAMSTGSRLAVDWIRNKRIAHELMLKKTTTQIQSIRTNVNIPFVLETLDRIEAEAIKAPESVQQPIIALSNLLRYGLYDVQAMYVPLAKELETLEDYFLLVNQNQARFSLSLCMKGTYTGTVVPPNLIVKVISTWKEFYQDRLDGTYKIHLEVSGQMLRLIILLPDSSESFLSVVHKRLVLSQQNGFAVYCKAIEKYMELEISYSKNEN